MTSVYCGQTVGRIKLQLGKQVGLGAGHIVLDGAPAPPPQRGRSPQFSAHMLWPNGWMEQDAKNQDNPIKTVGRDSFLSPQNP